MSTFGPNPGAVDPAQPVVDGIVAAPPAELGPELMEAFRPNIGRKESSLGTHDLEE
jgi:hypothetical protein